MPLCAKCCQSVCNPCIPCVPANDNEPIEHAIILASDRRLQRRRFVHQIAIAVAGLGLSRREIPNWMADVIFEFDGTIYTPDGTLFMFTDTLIDDAFNNDGSFRWLADLMAFAHTPPRQRPQGRVLDRLRLLDITFKIDRPEVAETFGT